MDSENGLQSTRVESIERYAHRNAMRDLPEPLSARRIAMMLLLVLPVVAIGLLAVPWQQSAVGIGSVVAYAPADRTQQVEAPISGRIAEWYVTEGQRVRLGELLVELVDNDPFLETRLIAQRAAAQGGLDAARAGLVAYEAKLVAEQAQRVLKIAEADAKIAEQERKRVGEAAEAETAGWNDTRIASLAAEGLSSTRERELAGLSLSKAIASVQARDAALVAARASRVAAERSVEATVAAVQAEVQQAQAKVAEAEAKLTEADSTVARFGQREVRAPRDGMVINLVGGPGGEQVSSGDVLMTLVPSTNSRAVEIAVDGNDVALVREGDHVRLLFEGWPAVQFVGFPGAGGGTFAGTVAFVDATDDGKGKFRILVVPDSSEGPWPVPERLRQGVRAKGFVLLGRVSLGYELWRQINGFPPLPPVEKGDKTVITGTKKPRSPSGLR
ncbi:MAG: multidrug resistance efflux pump [Myxococcota bacterium]|jgi:multidrug resistance efflux pump